MLRTLSWDCCHFKETAIYNVYKLIDLNRLEKTKLFVSLVLQRRLIK